jgi:hypothetical protein
MPEDCRAAPARAVKDHTKVVGLVVNDHDAGGGAAREFMLNLPRAERNRRNPNPPPGTLGITAPEAASPRQNNIDRIGNIRGGNERNYRGTEYFATESYARVRGNVTVERSAAMGAAADDKGCHARLTPLTPRKRTHEGTDARGNRT